MKAMELGQVVVQRLVRKVIQDGAVPLVVYLPYKSEVAFSAKSPTKDIPLSARMLQNALIKYFDPSACLTTIKATDTYMKGGHYSPQANTHIAHCLEPVLRGMIDALKR